MTARTSLIELPRIRDPRGSLTFLESEGHVPFTVRRAYWIYDSPADSTRDGHAHRTLHEALLAVSGSFEVHLDDGRERSSVLLNRPYRALHVPPMVWRQLDGFSAGAVCLVLASLPYHEGDYIRDQAAFRRVVAGDSA